MEVRTLKFLLAGALMGLAFLDPRAQFLVWVGTAGLVFAFYRTRTRAHAIAGFWAATILKQAIALHWLVLTGTHFLQWSLSLSVLAAALVWIISATLTLVPIALGAQFLGWLPVRWWLPPCWLLGETLVARTTGFSMGHLLYAQWAIPPVLRALAYVGWSATLLLGLYAAASAGESIAIRSRRGLLLPALMVMAMFALPPIPVPHELLRGIGAVHLVRVTELPERAPSGVDVLVWPEESIRVRPRAREGSLDEPVALRAFTFRSAAEHVMGLALRLPEGGTMNVAAFVDEQGLMRATRGKSVLVPLGERSFLGIPALAGEGFVPGRERPLLELKQRRVIPLICYEVFDREVSARGLAAGGTLVAVLSSDRPLAGSRIALEQSLGALVLRAVELNLPAVRASVGGSAALVLPSGEIVAQSPHGSSGVLAAGATR
jgi:apolipoprotein N-acyltransferase